MKPGIAAGRIPLAGPGFPGGIAGASLKPVCERDRGALEVDGFPGGIAGASLKRVTIGA